MSQFTYGTLGPQRFARPGAFNVNLTLSKHFVMKEKYTWNSASTPLMY